MTTLSIIITTYNRKKLVCDALTSALQFAKQFLYQAEIIVVDDASGDGTFEFLRDRYQKEISSGLMKLIRTEKNLGATGAKNLGASDAKGEWLLFADSDDMLIPETAYEVSETLKTHGNYPIIFFRCETMESGELIGPYYKTACNLTLKDFLNVGTPGECLPIVRSCAFARFPYVPELRGCEGLSYAQIIQKFGPARVENRVVRRYRTENEDRLCFSKGIRRRASCMAAYHRLMLTQFYKELSAITIIKTIVKMIGYRLYSLLGSEK